MPISEDLEFPRNFIYKISRYAKVVNIPNSMTVLPELMPISIEMAKRRLTGIYNFTNPGVVSHNEILELYRDYYRPDFTWENFTLEEQAKVITAARSNNELDATKLKQEFPDMLDIKSSLVKYVFEPQRKLEPGTYKPPKKANPGKAENPEVPLPSFKRDDGKTVFLILGGRGWIGGILQNLLKKMGHEFHVAKSRLEDRNGLLNEIDLYQPTHILNAAGVTGRPNVDWCEDNKIETLRYNVIGTMTLADICELKGIHMTNYATGCIFEYDKNFPLGSGKGFKEEDTPNFHGSFYAHSKGIVEELLKSYNHLLTLRVRMPISEDLEFPRNFVYKIAHYERVVDVPNSMTVLPELLPYSIEMALQRLTGIYNFTNPGVISHNECLELYKKYYKPDFTWKNFSLEEQSKVIKAGRSNNELDTTKFEKLFPQMLPIKESLIKYVFEPQLKKE